MSIGEPRHAPPEFVLDALTPQSRHGLGSYPTTRGRAAVARGDRALADAPLRAARRHRCDPETMVLPVNGTREALFAFVQAVIDPRRADAAAS